MPESTNIPVSKVITKDDDKVGRLVFRFRLAGLKQGSKRKKKQQK
jgi:hypothetical protein